MPRNYVTHEFFNYHWTLFYHADAARDLADAGLSFAGSGNLADNQDMLRFSAEQQQLLESVSDRVMRETVKDFFLSPLLRRDVFTKGRPKIPPARQIEVFGICRYALVVPMAKLERKALFPIGEVLFERELYDPILLALELKPQSLDDLLQRREIAGLGKARVAEALVVLLSAEYVMPAVDARPDSARATGRLNRALLGRLVNDPGKSLASPVLQNAIKAEWLERLLILCELDKNPNPQEFVWVKMKSQRHKLSRDGIILQSDAENMAELALQIHSFRTGKLPLLRQLGIL